VKKDKWTLQNLKPVSDKDLNEAERAFAVNTLNSFLSGKRISGSSYKRKKFDLAILVSQEDPTPPSDPKAIQKFIKAAEHVGFNVDLITRAEYGKITQYDALFIRETTNVNHHTYRFARKAQLEGLAVIDDPDSILRCTNKVCLNELLTANRISVPRTMVIRKDQKKLSNLQINFPAVIKVPDGSFSKGVKKVNSLVDLQKETKEFFKNTDLLIVQEFMPTDFDWRGGGVNCKVLYVCKYFMARNHWQIVDWGDGKYSRLGKSETISIDSAPHGLIKLALKAASLIGKGLYGLDIKEVKGRFFVIEINDNPSIESGVEDKVEKMNLYENIMSHLLTQVQNK
jgi:glutathione synthase/RimK-type ligase-like ATP-grasp enzyme